MDSPDHPRSRGVYSCAGRAYTNPEGSSPLARGLLRRRQLRRHCREDHPRSRGVYSSTSRSQPGHRGSSPLARGLPARRRPVAHGRGIIPARAGFTPCRRRECSGTADHPRSRGVYFAEVFHAVAQLGSSPLARGLPRRWAPPAHGGWIIPARAGFTGRRCGPVSVRQDHPRSRGVYRTGDTVAHWAGGSSPLARGLLDPPLDSFAALGIIPARAGFTRLRPLQPRWSRDHPRSRGVYGSRPVQRIHGVGSSPLARGLLVRGSDPPVQARIIPARAGFTCCHAVIFPSSWDHPRSRGVYTADDNTRLAIAGSSPLARGLRGCDYSMSGSQGIIPARAGFTHWRRHRRKLGSDHPRSRGVYPSEWLTWTLADGSSPLARGLPVMPVATSASFRIIPARAGFTPWRGLGHAQVWDHPRSRGVYAVKAAPPKAVKGSSPLARGLLVAFRRPLPRRGIIPARAGFTPEPVPRGVGGWDHPRSRGVYSTKLATCCSIPGSSPLARGLLEDGRAGERGRGIIPARAGFTRLPSPMTRSSSGSSPLARGLLLQEPHPASQGLDHPRSRGVYAPAACACCHTSGSSPLARGLPAADASADLAVGIIPARAGFTGLSPRRRARPRDHPRSRGVYEASLGQR